MARSAMYVLLLVLALGMTQASEMEKNPIRRIVTLLQDMSQEVTEEGEKEKELYKKFMCFCEGNTANMNKETEDAKNAIQQLTAVGMELVATKKRIDAELKDHQQDRAEAQAAMKKATAIREKEHAEYTAEAGDSKTNIEAINKAIPALQRGLGISSLIQSQSGAEAVAVLRKIALVSRTASAVEKQTLLAFLSEKDGVESPYGDYKPASGEIVGILKQMKDEMDQDLGGIVQVEEVAAKSYVDMRQAKRMEIAAASEAIEAKTKRSGELAVSIVENKGDLRDTTSSLSASEELVAHLAIQCETKSQEWEVRQKTRQEELIAISEAIKVLNDDDSLDLFKKTLPTPGKPAGFDFLQEAKRSQDQGRRALAILSAAAKGRGSPKLDLISFMLSSKKVNFFKVMKMIDNMVAHLKKEQVDDNKHQEYCEVELDQSADKKKLIEGSIESRTLEIDESAEGVSRLAEELEGLNHGVSELDKAVATASEQRKAENREFVQTQSELEAASQLIEKAKNRLQKFYNPKLYSPLPQRDLTEEERIAQNFGGEVAQDAPQMIAGTSQTMYVQLQSRTSKAEPTVGEAPSTWDNGYKAKGAKSGGVVALMDMLKSELTTEMQEGQHDEETAQKEYEQLMSDSATKRAKDTTSITDKMSAKAELVGRTQDSKDQRSVSNDELVTTNGYISSLHKDCDFIMENHQFRSQARTTEIEALANAKAVLNGASFGFLQKRA